MRKSSGFYPVMFVGLFVFCALGFAESHQGNEADVTRKVAPPYYTGVLKLQPREVAIDNCKPGDRCVVKGEIGSEGDLFAQEFTSFSKGEKGPVVKEERLTKKTASGSEFKRVSEEELKRLGIKDSKKFGEAWEDPSGMIWGDIVKKEDGSPHYMNHKDAIDYCKSIGADLPSREDFVRLREYMGAKPGRSDGYAPQILPNLTYTDKGETYSRYFWSSSVRPDFSNSAYVFNGRLGDFDTGYRSYDVYYLSVRCVGARR